MLTLRQTERQLRSRVMGSPFVLSTLLTRFEVFGRQNLLAAIQRHRNNGTGLITFSNHQSLFDDPMVLLAVLRQRDFTEETKHWWSTGCQTNFSPEGRDPASWFIRYFSDVSKMVFFARHHKQGCRPTPESYLEALGRSDKSELADRIIIRAGRWGQDGESFLRRFVTSGDAQDSAALNQLGMVEACARVELGDWLHFFPEGGRSRNLELRPPRRGIGKVLYHCRQAELIPICFCGMQDVLPIGTAVPRPLQRVIIFVGEPIPTGRLNALRRGAPGRECFEALTAAVWESVQSLWHLALTRYRRERVLVPPLRLPKMLRSAAERVVEAPARAVAAAGLATARETLRLPLPLLQLPARGGLLSSERA